jgi:phage FluMu gp28-like protein
MWARGNGKSAIAALKLVLEIFESEAVGKPSNWLIVSASREQAAEALKRVQAWAKGFYLTAKHLEIITEEIVLKTPEGQERYTRYELRLGNNTRVLALAASPRAIRGYTSNIWWDEACFFENDHEAWAAIQHCTRGRLKIIVTSTPIGGDEKKFYQIIHDSTEVRGKALWSKHICDIREAIALGRPYDYETEMAAANDPDAWAQEMLLEWIDNASTWFPFSLIHGCEDDRASEVGDHYQGGACYIGNDVGLRGDKWVAWVVERVGNLFVTREVVVLGRSLFADHDAEIAELFAKYKVHRLCIDQGGMGERSTEEYINLYGSSRVEGVLFNAENKGDMAVLGKKLMEQKRLLLAPNQPETRRDLRKLQKVVSAAGAIRFNAERDKGGHADRCWAMLLACNAAETPVVEMELMTSGSGQTNARATRGFWD